ncbi:hypothetical protein ACD575_06240 [Campylobacter sp. LH-2024]|uniref:Uncharacterized protein n=2 Tax=Campylobacteraceae TaxID=72294 RepID=A0ACC5W1M2_9BACT|nr:hypothetical protein [Campylobacter sp. RM10537]MBZ7928380.1 hypothetical protein [Campylobacter sp. RM10542]MBZ7929479.1 hypothetical protein [Campylobacter sp. W0067]MBZ7931843.1 hypothetical protein [Campylobacter sp. RM12910]MBZ7943440.1 hypothetical protein [Campylobacter sp. RM13744]MBZ7945995.1 hypothetical protein [Campylobacter sp. RM10536]MBZ7950576.1 hypothetical protein [Campylobacter sp. W0046]MBZ7956822.1 hypothetical protein [Campylobacter sp. RM10541]MBZ7958207.1 hypothet
MTRINEKSLRVKYLRSLEKFANTAKSCLKREDFNLEKFQERMQKNKKNLEKCQAVVLNSTYSKALENFVNACLDFSLKKEELLYLANALSKLKNQNYKEKHKNYLKDYND